MSKEYGADAVQNYMMVRDEQTNTIIKMGYCAVIVITMIGIAMVI